LENTTADGAPAELRHSTSFGLCGDSAIELIEVHACAPAAVRETFVLLPPPRLHHLAWAVPDLEAAGEALAAAGAPEFLRARLGDIRFTYHDATRLLGHHIELHADGPALQ